MKRICLLILGFTVLTFNPLVFACESVVDSVVVEPLFGKSVIEVTAKETEQRSITVNHEVKEKDIYVECIINNFTFVEEKKGMAHVDGQGHLALYIDGNEVDSIYKAAFIIKGLPKGKHTVKIELMKNNNKPYGIEEEFSVTIPE